MGHRKQTDGYRKTKSNLLIKPRATRCRPPQRIFRVSIFNCTTRQKLAFQGHDRKLVALDDPRIVEDLIATNPKAIRWYQGESAPRPEGLVSDFRKEHHVTFMPTVDACIYKTPEGADALFALPNCYRRRRGKCKSSGWNSPGSRFQKTREGTFFAHEPNHAKGGCPCTDAATSKRAKKERRRRGLAPKLVLLAHKQALGGDGNDRVLAVFDVPAGGKILDN